MTKKQTNEIVQEVTNNFRTFGGGKGSQFNPLAEALKNQPPQFAAGVSVEEVVRFIIGKIKKINHAK